MRKKKRKIVKLDIMWIGYDPMPGIGKCCWPIGDGAWCGGHAKIGKSYCQEHLVLSKSKFKQRELDIEYLVSLSKIG